MNVNKWIEEINKQLKLLMETRLDFLIDVNKIFPPTDEKMIEKFNQQFKPSMPTQLQEFYENCSRVDFPDIYNGYFIFPLDRIMKAEALLLPTKIAGSKGGDIISFGSDGGGNLFVVRTNENAEILYLKLSLVERSTYFPNFDDDIITISDDFNSFLERLLDDVKAFVREDQNWSYIDETDTKGTLNR